MHSSVAARPNVVQVYQYQSLDQSPFGSPNTLPVGSEIAGATPPISLLRVSPIDPPDVSLDHILPVRGASTIQIHTEL